MITPTAMPAVTFTTTEEPGWTLVEFVLANTVAPGGLRSMKPPNVDLRRGVVLSGQGPIWLIAALTHHYRPAAWVSIMDRRLGAVVVQSHTRGVEVGDTPRPVTS